MQVYSSDLGNNFSIQIFSSITSIDGNTWNSITDNIPFYKTHQFLSVVEKIQQDIQFRFILIKKDEVVFAAMYMQLLNFSFSNLVNYSSNNSNGIKAKIKKFIAKKNTKLLNLGNVFFTGDNGIICNNDDEIIPVIPQIFKLTNKTFKDKNQVLL